jgi:hypothetical protein
MVRGGAPAQAASRYAPEFSSIGLECRLERAGAGRSLGFPALAPARRVGPGAAPLTLAPAPRLAPQIFFTFFRTLVGQSVELELKNDLRIRGTLLSVDQYLNLKIGDVEVQDKAKFPQLLSLKTIFVRGSVVRYVHVPPAQVDAELLQDAARKEAMEAQKGTGKAR